MHLPTLMGVTVLFVKYVCMHAVLCAIDETVWDSVKNGWVRPIIVKSEWDKAALTLANANSKAINAIFCGVFTDEFHRISHVKTAKEAWIILETTYERTKKVKDTKLEMLTTRFEEVKMSHLIPFMGDSIRLLLPSQISERRLKMPKW